MKSLREHMDEECLDEEQLDEGRVGWVAKSSIAALRGKQASFQNQIKQEPDLAKKMDILSEQVASMSSNFIVLLAVMNKDAKSVRRVR